MPGKAGFIPRDALEARIEGTVDRETLERTRAQMVRMGLESDDALLVAVDAKLAAIRPHAAQAENTVRA